MEIIIQPDERAGYQFAARKLAALVKDRPDAVLGLITGRTAVPLYQEVIRIHRDERLTYASVRTFNLDEYVGLPHDHPASFHAFMKTHLFEEIDIKPANTHILNGRADDIARECQEYERRIRECGGIDLQILGIGGDGHIGFNEPSSSLGSRTRIKTLTDGTRRDNAHAFGKLEDVPRHVVTMGVGTIMDARSCMILAFGVPKATAVARAVEGPVTAMVPASALQFHPDVKVILDPHSAAQLARKEYYLKVFQEKPKWQR
ncbi:MAG: glucosamine-6-phosphate deaminase [Vicinamibacterales bacterium]